MASAALRIEAKTYTLDERPLGNGLVRGTFHKRYAHRKRRFEIFPYVWHLAFVRGILPGQISLFSGGEKIPVVGDHAVFLPAHAILDWELGPGDFVIETVKSAAPLGPEAPQIPILFELGNFAIPETLASVRAALGLAAGARAIVPAKEPNAMARKTKSYLDAHFLENESIADIARVLRASRSVMTRSFTRSYGLSPVLYRNHLRVFEAMALLTLKNFRVAEASFHCGFKDVSNFNRQFRKIVEHVPSAFRPSPYRRRETFSEDAPRAR